jgi:hypothetical protein
VANFMNLKIKPAQSFGVVHRSKVCACVFIEVISHTYMNIYVFTVFLKKKKNELPLSSKKMSYLSPGTQTGLTVQVICWRPIW